VGFADALDYLTLDPETESVLMYVEGVRHARHLMSALRAAARIKPVIVLKAGRDEPGSRAATTHTGAMTGSDAVFEAALRRAGAVRVGTFIQLFSAAKCLASRYRPVGNQIAVVTNGGGPGVMAADRAQECGLRLATLAPDTRATLDAALPAAWSRGNPVDLLEDATTQRYATAFEACLADPGVDGVVAILTPQAMTDALCVARAVVDASRRHDRQIIACWMGDAPVSAGREALQAARIPVFRSPEPAVEAFANITSFYQNQRLLMRVPGPLSQQAPPDLEAPRAVIETALAGGRTTLSEVESKAILAAFRIPVAATVVARSVEEAILVAGQVGYPVALKAIAADVPHKADAGGVRLGITGATQLREAFEAILASVRAAHPSAHLDGVAVEPMVLKPAGRELMIGVLKDPVFGPVITFGAGGGDVELLADRAVALPPLDGFLARNLVDRARAALTLGPWRNRLAADLDALEAVLLRVSEMVCELPWLKEMDINPLILDYQGATVADARIVIEPLAVRGADAYAHMAISPYPSGLGRRWTTRDGREVVLRAIRPEDAGMEQAFVRGLSDEARYFRFINAMHELSERMLVRFTQIDSDREMALAAVVRDPADDSESQIGVARYVGEPDGRSCEFALVVTDGWQGQGVGTRLMEALMDAARARGLETMEGFVLGSDHKMLKLMESLGFSIATDPEDPSMKHVTRRLA
jgi:acetyltransferase